jgi:MFS family permease
MPSVNSNATVGTEVLISELTHDQQVGTPRRALAFGSITHVWSDAFFALLHPLLPFIALDLNLTYSQSGLLKGIFAGATGVLQIPSGFLAERWGEFGLLVGGNVWVGAGLVAMGLAQTYGVLLAAAAAAGLGGGTQHPVASAMVARTHERGRAYTAIGTLNFAGDLGKMVGPAVAAVAVVTLHWRTILILVGGTGAAFMAASVPFHRRVRPPPSRADADEASAADDADSPTSGFIALIIAGMLDATTRGAALTFLPFVLADKGLGASQISGLFVVLFAGGAAGKLLLGWLGDRMGPLALIWGSKGLAAVLLVVFLAPLPGAALIPLIAVLGFGLNGTSSVFYGTVARLVSQQRAGRRYGIYYTATEVASASAPALYGVLADMVGLSSTMTTMAAVTLAVLPASLLLRRYL